MVTFTIDTQSVRLELSATLQTLAALAERRYFAGNDWVVALAVDGVQAKGSSAEASGVICGQKGGVCDGFARKVAL